MNIKLLKLDDNDYSLVTEMWTKRNHIVIPKDFLTDFGILAKQDKVPVACAWLFPVLSSKTCMIRYPVSNPEIDSNVRNTALDLVFDNLHIIAKEMGYTKVFITTNHENLKKRLLKYDYTEEAQNCTHFWGGL